jgi:TRAP-type mannitol/chloroaromatic compound transport system permease small subunit/TM2 domain-containing membrane protein YozV
MYFVRRELRRGSARGPSLFIAYLFWLCSGFMGLHRFYLRSNWGFIFIPVFLLILHTTDVIRDKREDVSRTRAAVGTAISELEHAKVSPGATVTPQMQERLAKAEAAEPKIKADFEEAQADLTRWYGYSRWFALLMAAMLVGDAILLPGLVRKQGIRESEVRANASPEIVPQPQIGTHEDPTLAMHTRFTDAIEWINIRVGEFVAYWAVISVFGYYYEVIARFAFNSPTNWLHESMFLMYGMQYMLAGAYAYQCDQHVRVDVFYVKFSPRGKAIADIITSVFFFIFAFTLLFTSWRFAMDSFNPGGTGEVSFTEWGVQYWPVKLMMPIGAALLALQGLSKLIKDIVILKRGRA